MVEPGRGNSTALIVAPRGKLRESLAAMLVALLPQDVIILEADDVIVAERMLSEQHLAVLIIDGDLGGHTWARLVEAARTQRPPVPCSILVDTTRQHAAAMKAGANHASFKGEPPPRLFMQVERLLGLQ